MYHMVAFFVILSILIVINVGLLLITTDKQKN